MSMDGTSCVIALKGNITFHETLRVFQNDYEFWEFHDCRVVVQDNDLLITMKTDGRFQDYTIDYEKVWRIGASPKMMVPLNFEYHVGRDRFKVVHSLPSDTYYVTDTFKDYFADTFKIFSVEEGKSKANGICDFLNRQEERVNLYASMLLFNRVLDED